MEIKINYAVYGYGYPLGYFGNVGNAIRFAEKWKQFDLALVDMHTGEVIDELINGKWESGF